MGENVKYVIDNLEITTTIYTSPNQNSKIITQTLETPLEWPKICNCTKLS